MGMEQVRYITKPRGKMWCLLGKVVVFRCIEKKAQHFLGSGIGFNESSTLWQWL
jgi:hypothetical protein